MRERGAGHLPDESQKRLLEAALMGGERFARAWESFQRRPRSDWTDPSIRRLLPLIYRNAKSQVRSDSLLTALREVYLECWGVNQIRLESVAAVLEAFRDLKIEAMFLKGAALSLAYWGDLALRPMGDIDILVERSEAETAVDCLLKRGWASEEARQLGGRREGFRDVLAYCHGVSFLNERNVCIDLHWHVGWFCPQDRFDKVLWERSIWIDFRGSPVRILDATDQLLHVCLHGSGGLAERGRSFHWVADAMRLIRLGPGNIDWRRLIGIAESFGLALRLRDAITYLRDEFRANIPLEAIRNAYGVRVSRLERLEYRFQSSPRADSVLGNLPIFLLDVWRQGNDLLSPSTVPRALGYLGFRWGLKTPWQLPLAMIVKSFRRGARSFLSRGK